MTFYDIIAKIKAEAIKYNGSGEMMFDFGTLAQLNAIAVKTYPLVFVVDDPDLVVISQAGTRVVTPNTPELYTFFMMVYQSQRIDGKALETQDIYTSAKLIGDGILKNLDGNNDDIEITKIEKTLVLKDKDDVLTGIGYRISITAPDEECTYPFE